MPSSPRGNPIIIDSASTATSVTRFEVPKQRTRTRSATPMSKLKRLEFLFGVPQDSKETTFSGLKIRDKNESKFQSGFQIPAELPKTIKRPFHERHKSFKEIDVQGIEYRDRQLNTPLGSTIINDNSRDQHSARGPIRSMSRERNPVL